MVKAQKRRSGFHWKEKKKSVRSLANQGNDFYQIVHAV
jgi:hypothetical protein